MALSYTQKPKEILGRNWISSLFESDPQHQMPITNNLPEAKCVKPNKQEG
jgi:hypothetical protein